MWKGRSGPPSRVRAAALFLALLLSAPAARAACGPVPADHPVLGLERLILGNGGRVNGLPFPSYNGTAFTAVDPDTGNLVAAAPALPSLDPPAFPPNPGTVNTSAATVPAGNYNTVTAVAATTVLPGGTYHINTLRLNNGVTVRLGSGDYFIDNLVLNNNGSLTVAVGAVARVYIGTRVTAGNFAGFVGFGALDNLRIFLYGGARIEVGNNALVLGLIYAPGPTSRIRFGNDTRLIGAALTGGQLQFGNDSVLTYPAVVEAAIRGISTCAPGSGPDHFAISHGGTGVTCQAEPVTITAHDATHNPVTYSGSLSLNTSTGRGDWSRVTGAGALNNGSPDDGAATYAFTNESSVVLALRHTQPGAVNIGVASGSVVESVAEDPTLAFADSGFRFVDGAGVETIANQVAGTASPTYFLQAIRKDDRTGACVGVFGAGETVNLELAFQCKDPDTCAGRQVAFTNNAATTLLAANPDAEITAWTPVAVKFLNDGSSRADFGFAYADAGRIRLAARYNLPLEDGSPSGNFMWGASYPFVVKPAGFVLSGIRRTADGFANPAAADAAGSAFIAAGDPFTVTVTAVASDGSTALPNYGRESTAEGVRLAAGLVAPAGEANPTLANAAGFGAFAAGAATGTAFSWGEVGIIRLTPAVADSDYLGAGDVSGPVSGNVGRFIPHHFGFASPVLTNRAALACSPASPFSYMDEGMTAAFGLNAESAAGDTTQNYAGAFAKLDLDVPAAFGFGARDGAGALSARLDLASSSGEWAAGVAAVSTSLAFRRRSAPDDPDGPFEALKIGVAPVDGDGVKLEPVALDLDVSGDATNDHATVGQTRVRFGRLRLDSAHGSELLPLPVPALTQYWNGTVFVTNADDDCTTFAAGDFALTNFGGNLAAGETTVTPSTVSFTDGRGNLRLGAPGSGNNGSAILGVDLGAAARYLLGRWDATDQGGDGSFHDDDPQARVSFGIYRGGDEFIYLRENF